MPSTISKHFHSEAPNFYPNLSLPRHRWYRFKEGFSAGLVRAFVNDYLDNRKHLNLLDPFLGSGTTAVEGARLGLNVQGIETNPFMAFLSRVKTADYRGNLNLEALAVICLKNRVRDKAFELPRYTTLVQRRGLNKWLLNHSVAIRFEQIRSAISRIRPSTTRDLLLLALMASVEYVANARKDGKCWRYKQRWQELEFNGNSLEDCFASQILRFAEDIQKFPSLDGTALITKGDARGMDSLIPRRRIFDALLTSPPYLNSFDYTDIYRPELLLMKKVRSACQLRKLRFATLRSHVQVAWRPSAPLEIPILRDVIDKIARDAIWNGKIPEMINAYFVDLDHVIRQCARRLKVGGIAAFVVADSAYSGVVIPVDLVLKEILRSHGFAIQTDRFYRQTLGNGHHQKRSDDRLCEVMVVAEYRGNKTLSPKLASPRTRMQSSNSNAQIRKAES